MKKVSKGTTLIEIMISVILISTVLIFVFNILADLKYEDALASKRSDDAISRASYTKIIQNDFIMNFLKKIEKCNEPGSKLCIQFSFDKIDEPKKLIIYQKNNNQEHDYVVYGDEKWDLEYGNYEIGDNQTIITYYDSNQISDDIINHSYLKIFIPVKYSTTSNRKYDIELVYLSDRPLEDIDQACTQFGNNINCEKYN